MLDLVSGTLSRYSMCAPGDHVAVAVSGGADSVCLLHVLRELAPALRIKLSVAHLNHKLRGLASEEDAGFVRELAIGFDLSFIYEESDVALLGGNLEQAGREARREFFSRVPADRVATGHTRSDQAETVLYRLLRGSGTAGLAGISPTVNNQIRPLLHCSREQVIAYLQSRNLVWREDVTNTDTAFARNRIRHQVLPFLWDINPAVEETLARTAQLAKDEEEFWHSEVQRLASQLVRRKSPGLILNVDKLAYIHPAARRRLLRWAVRKVKGDLRGIDLSDIERLMALAAQKPGHGRAQAPGIDVFRSFDWLYITLPRTESRAERDYCSPLPAPGFATIPGQRKVIRVEVDENAEYRAPAEGYNKEGCLDACRLSGPLELRNWRPGDQFCRRGHSIEKIKTLFQSARIPLWDRQGWPVITSGGRVVWARGFGVSSEFVPARESRRILRIWEEESESAESNTSDSASLYYSVDNRDGPHRENE